MSELFTITFQLGRGARLSTIREAVHDLEVVGAAAQSAAVIHIEREAQQSLIDTYLGPQGGLRALVDMAQSREMLTKDDLDYFNADPEFDDELDDLLHFFPLRHSRRGRKTLAWSLLGAALFHPAGPGRGPWNRLFDRLVTVETTEQRADVDPRVRTLRYANPIKIEIDIGAAATIRAMAVLLGVIRDWKAQRRQSAAIARDAEDATRARSRLRQIYLERIARGDLNVTTQEVTSLLTEPLLIATDRLADRDVSFEREQLPEDRSTTDR